MYQTVCHKLSPFCCLCSLLHWPCLQIDLREVKLTPWIMNRHQDWSLSLDMASGNAAIFLWGLAMYGNAKLQTVKKKLIVRKKRERFYCFCLEIAIWHFDKAGNLPYLLSVSNNKSYSRFSQTFPKRNRALRCLTLRKMKQSLRERVGSNEKFAVKSIKHKWRWNEAGNVRRKMLTSPCAPCSAPFLWDPQLAFKSHLYPQMFAKSSELKWI